MKNTNENEKPILSIYVATYNHEEYIEKALDSIFMQKTKYSYEVLVGEDCSTDGTREVLKEYERKHPQYVQSGRLKIFYRSRNMYTENTKDLKNRAKGKYIIALEGDDYWTDENKINCQIVFLEQHLDYIAVAHKCEVVDENGKHTDENYPECNENEYRLQHFMNNIIPGQLATVMYRNIYNGCLLDLSLIEQGLIPGDRILYLTLILHGKIFCIQKVMSAYRHVTTHGDSFSANHKYSFVETEKYYRAILLYMRKFTKTEKKYGEILYVRCIMKGIKAKQCSFQEAMSYFSEMKYKCYALRMWVCYKWRKDIMHRTVWM